MSQIQIVHYIDPVYKIANSKQFWKVFWAKWQIF